MIGSVDEKNHERHHQLSSSICCIVPCGRTALSHSGQRPIYGPSQIVRCNRTGPPRKRAPEIGVENHEDHASCRPQCSAWASAPPMPTRAEARPAATSTRTTSFRRKVLRRWRPRRAVRRPMLTSPIRTMAPGCSRPTRTATEPTANRRVGALRKGPTHVGLFRSDARSPQTWRGTIVRGCDWKD